MGGRSVGGGGPAPEGGALVLPEESLFITSTYLDRAPRPSLPREYWLEGGAETPSVWFSGVWEADLFFVSSLSVGGAAGLLVSYSAHSKRGTCRAIIDVAMLHAFFTEIHDSSYNIAIYTVPPHQHPDQSIFSFLYQNKSKSSECK